MKKLKLTIKYFILLFVFILPVVYLLSGEKLDENGRAYYDLAPDGKYKAMLVYINGQPFGYQMVINEDSDVVYVAKNGKDDVTPGVYIWGSNKHETYDYVSMIYGENIELPPSYFEQFYAWFFVHIKSFNLSRMEMKPVSAR